MTTDNVKMQSLGVFLGHLDETAKTTCIYVRYIGKLRSGPWVVLKVPTRLARDLPRSTVTFPRRPYKANKAGSSDYLQKLPNEALSGRG